MAVIKHNGTPAGPQPQSGNGADLNILKTLLSGRSGVRKIHRVTLIFSANTSETKFPSAPHTQNDFQASYSEVRKINLGRILLILFPFFQRNVLIKLTPSKCLQSNKAALRRVGGSGLTRLNSTHSGSQWWSELGVWVISFFEWERVKEKQIVQPLEVKALFDSLLCSELW